MIAVNTTLGVVQEVRAGWAIAALGTLTAPQARIVRGGVAQIVPAQDVVEGDLLRLAAGDIVPADARLLRAEGLETDEAAPAGESIPVAKSVAVVPDEGTRWPSAPGWSTRARW